MKLLLTRDQRSALIGSRPVFTLVVRADLDPTDRSAIDKYKLADTELYASPSRPDPPEISWLA